MKEKYTSKNMPQFKQLIIKPHGVIIMSLFASFFADIKCINWGLVHGGFVGDGILGVLYSSSIAIIFISALLYKKGFLSALFSYPIILSFILIIFYHFTLIFDGQPSVSHNFFFVFTIAALIIPQIISVDAKCFVAAMMIFPSFSILRINLIFQSYLDWMNVISMDASYGYLVPIVANVVYLFEYYKKDSYKIKFFVILITIVNFIIFLQLFFFGSRGPLLAIVLLVIFLLVTKVDYRGIVYKKNRVKFICISILSVILTFHPLLLLINNYLYDNGISIYAIEKILNLSQEGDISNGRSELNAITIAGFIDSPLWGNGIARFAEKSNSGLEYPHNFLLQILYDGGIILFGLILIPIFIKIKKLFKQCNHSQYVVFCTLFFASVPGALLSQDMWNIPVLWLFFGFILSKSFVYIYAK